MTLRFLYEQVCMLYIWNHFTFYRDWKSRDPETREYPAGINGEYRRGKELCNNIRWKFWNKNWKLRILFSLFIFYKKLVIPALTVAVAFGFLEWLLTQQFSLNTVGIYYIFTSMFFHYYIYEQRNPGEYYFYYNMGLSKIILWGTSLFLSLIITLILVVMEAICR